MPMAGGIAVNDTQRRSLRCLRGAQDGNSTTVMDGRADGAVAFLLCGFPHFPDDRIIGVFRSTVQSLRLYTVGNQHIFF